MIAEMMNDYRRTDQCNFSLAQKSFDTYKQAWMVRKGDPLTEIYNRG